MLTILFGIIVIYNILDVYQTYLLIQFGVPEWNPVINYLSESMGFLSAAFIVKYSSLLFLWVTICVWREHKP